MLGLAQHAGHDIVSDPVNADVLVVNTCAFIDRAKQESVDAILEMAQHRRSGRCSRLVVTGCLAERYRDELRHEIPEIDEVLGTGDVPLIVAAIEARWARRERRIDTRISTEPQNAAASLPFYRISPAVMGSPDLRARTSHVAHRTAHLAPRILPTYLYDADTPRLQTTPRHFAYLKVAEGCDYTCAFCIIPTLRGKYRSRTRESIVREARALAERGVKELLLISQDTTFYGIDRGERGALAGLLRELNAIDGLTWIRMLYLYPTTVTDDALEAMRDCEKVCRYIDLPLQHASAQVLKRMRRPGNRKTYEKLLEKIRTRLPGVTLRTTFIVGFPGETEQDFAELDSFVQDTQFDHVGVFTYSHEEGTRAYAVADDVSSAMKRRRRAQLMKRQQSIVAKALTERIGRDVQLLVDGPSREHELVLQARLEGQAPDIDSVVYLTDCDPSRYSPGDLIRARIVAARGYDLVAAPATG